MRSWIYIHPYRANLAKNLLKFLKNTKNNLGKLTLENSLMNGFKKFISILSWLENPIKLALDLKNKPLDFKVMRYIFTSQGTSGSGSLANSLINSIYAAHGHFPPDKQHKLNYQTEDFSIFGSFNERYL